MKAKPETHLPHTGEADVAALGEDRSFEDVRVELEAGPGYEEIQLRAYEIHIERGADHGKDLEDWLQAEAELKAKYPGIA